MTDARNGGKLTKFAFESYWEKSQQFSLFHQITTYNEKRDKRRLPAHNIQGREHWRYSTISRWGVVTLME